MVLVFRSWTILSILLCSVATVAHGVIALRQGNHLARCRKHPRGSKQNLFTTALCSRQNGDTVSSCGSLWENGEGNDTGQNQLLFRGGLTTPIEDRKILLESMIVYFEAMIDPETLRFFLYSYPQSTTDCNSLSSSSSMLSQPAITTQPSLRCHAHCPLRDMGSAWDACKAVKILRNWYCRQDTAHPKRLLSTNLEDAILQTTRYYTSSLVAIDGCNQNSMHLSPELLKEPPKISHNALLLLGLVGLEELGALEITTTTTNNYDGDDDDACQEQSKLVGSVEPLVLGILSLQRSDGAFKTKFKNDDDVYSDIAFSPGQAMTALMDVYLHPALVNKTTLDQILPSVLRAFEFYQDRKSVV